jgi:hypothetical protein
MHGEDGMQSWACERAVCGGAARGRAGFDTVYKYEVVQPLDSVHAELCEYARCVESCFGDKFVRRVGEEGEERGETSDGG